MIYDTHAIVIVFCGKGIKNAFIWYPICVCVSFLLKVMRENIIVVKRKIPVLVKSHGRTFQATCGRVSQHHM